MGEGCLIQAAETWRSVVGWEGFYEVSDGGNVRAVDRVVTRKDGTVQTWKARALSPFCNSSGYLVVRLSRPGERIVTRVHRLVADAFLPAAHTTETVNHIDGNKRANAAANLEWATRTENTQHAIRTGLGAYAPPRMRGEANGHAKLTAESVRAARSMYAAGGASFRGLAKIMGVAKKTMRSAILGFTWTEVQPLPDPPHGGRVEGEGR